jgi:hypothetical protein
MPIDWRISHKSARENKISERRIEKMTKWPTLFFDVTFEICDDWTIRYKDDWFSPSLSSSTLACFVLHHLLSARKDPILFCRRECRHAESPSCGAPF